MEPKEFESTPEFERFKKGMRRILTVPKQRLDEFSRSREGKLTSKWESECTGKKEDEVIA